MVMPGVMNRSETFVSRYQPRLSTNVAMVSSNSLRAFAKFSLCSNVKRSISLCGATLSGATLAAFIPNTVQIYRFLSDITEPHAVNDRNSDSLIRDRLSLIEAVMRKTTAPGKARPDPTPSWVSGSKRAVCRRWRLGKPYIVRYRSFREPLA